MSPTQSEFTVLRQTINVRGTVRMALLPHEQPQIRQVERNVLETEERTCLADVPFHDVGGDGEGGQRDPALHTPEQFDQLEMHVDRFAQLGVV